MCGFTVFIGYDNPMIINLLGCSDRGGDETVIKKYDDITIVFHRLSINGIDNGSQPMIKDNVLLVCNGEIYNHSHLRSSNKLSEAETGSDCEVILDLYNKYGSLSFVNDLDGVFAFALYDMTKHVMYCARDKYGVRPMYMATDAKTKIVVSSTLKGVPKDMKYVSQFKPSKYVELYLSEDNTKEIKYKSWLRNTKVWETNVQMALINAVKKRMMSERPIGCLLSGGIDSSLITSLVVKEHIRNGGKASDIRTFSIGMKGSPDLHYAKIVADYLGTTHTAWEYDASVFIKNIPYVIMDIGTYDVTTVRASVGNWLVARNIRETTDIKVVFNGDGADEVCSGYIYSSLAPDVEELDKDQRRLLDNIHHFDVLRSDRSIATHGLEPRTPFLDKEFVAIYSAIDKSQRAPKCVPGASQESHEYRHLTKWYLRKQFEGYLPTEILWRTKEAFSDGISSTEKSWHQLLKDYYKTSLGETEENVYKAIYEKYYGKMFIIPYKWMPQWSSTDDPSARTLDCYEKS